jgi:hypothetical protein
MKNYFRGSSMEERLGNTAIACVALVRKAADEIRITICFQILRSKENK